MNNKEIDVKSVHKHQQEPARKAAGGLEPVDQLQSHNNTCALWSACFESFSHLCRGLFVLHYIQYQNCIIFPSIIRNLKEVQRNNFSVYHLNDVNIFL